jgi:hypothetical protein
MELAEAADISPPLSRSKIMVEQYFPLMSTTKSADENPAQAE